MYVYIKRIVFLYNIELRAAWRIASPMCHNCLEQDVAHICAQSTAQCLGENGAGKTTILPRGTNPGCHCSTHFQILGEEPGVGLIPRSMFCHLTHPTVGMPPPTMYYNRLTMSYETLHIHCKLAQNEGKYHIAKIIAWSIYDNCTRVPSPASALPPLGEMPKLECTWVLAPSIGSAYLNRTIYK